MAPIRYSLHYEDYSEHLMSRFGKLLQLQSLVDMTLMCSSHTLRVHKAVLAASSTYFQEVLQKETGEPLIILKMRFSVLKCLVEFMYCGKTQCLEENLDELFSAAQFLKIKGLSKVTKEGLGITNSSELPVFTPPVVINRPPQSIIDLHAQDNVSDRKSSQQHVLPPTNTSQTADPKGQNNSDMVIRLPFDVEKGVRRPASGAEYEDSLRSMKPRRGRPNARRPYGWEGTSAGGLGRAAERALLRREQDSRKAIHHLKHLQTIQMQDYMDRVTLSQAVNSICDSESSSSRNFMNLENDLMYMDQTISSNVLDSNLLYSREHRVNKDVNMSSTYSTATNSSTDTTNSGIGNAMSQYVNALKNAGLPTDLPILFESGDGSYINVNEQVLLDMVQSSEIQYEVIEQPNIIEKVADPSEIKSIDDLSKSIERGEMLIGNKNYTSSDFDKKTSQYNRDIETINSLNAILPDNLETFTDQQNYVVLDPRLQESHNSMDMNMSNNDFPCIDGDMQFFTKSMSDDVKKYYNEQQIADRDIDQLCPTSTSIDTNFNMSLLETKNQNLNENMDNQFNSLSNEELKQNEEFDFGLQLPQTTDETLDCLMSTSKIHKDAKSSYNHSNDINKRTDESQISTSQKQAEIIKDLMDLDPNMSDIETNNSVVKSDAINSSECSIQEFKDNPLNADVDFDDVNDRNRKEFQKSKEKTDDLAAIIASSGIQWESIDYKSEENDLSYEKIENKKFKQEDNHEDSQSESTKTSEEKHLTMKNKKDELFTDEGQDDVTKENEVPTNVNSTLEDDIPYAVGLRPLKQVQYIEDEIMSKRKNSIDDNLFEDSDAKYLKRKLKYKKLL